MARNGGGSWWQMAEEVEDFVEHLPPPLLPSDSEQVHVLAVDDSFVDRKVIERLLKISSCKVTAVDSGRRALQYLGLDGDQRSSSVRFDKMKVDMIITDYCMPGMTGYELLKKIKESSTFREIPVVIMSSENVLARINRCLEDGAEDFIVKPVQLSDVRRLTDYMMREIKVGDEEERKITKRKLREDSSCDPASSSPSVSSSRSSSPTQPSSYPSPLSSSSPSPSPNPPSSPTSLDTPIRRLKMTTID